ncbi:hypothetical protein F4806DRAFT_461440 [Annulohypoxylon nitens]|nr:hypothetical protein F4806DRAFT_461440 [Annulohypoxylon nitens]KAI1442744.1 hypothetical protein F5Y02DRAFT_395471 [Annulohypoxylon stygium]
MPVYHIVLFKLKPGVKQEVIDEFVARAKSMVNEVPGLTKVDIGPPLPVSVPRGQGYNMALVSVLGKQEDLPVYAAHPAHLRAHELREQLCEDTLVYDMEFP